MFIRRCTLALAALVTYVWASSGDRSWEFQSCVTNCDLLNCQPDSHSSPLPLALRVTRWSCMDDCKYQCMHRITDRDVDRGIPVQQYYGKWPFRRFAGMQEPAAVSFSLLNLLAHIRGAQNVLKRIPDSHPMKNMYFTWSLVSSIAWVWSAVFHTRDIPITEKMDYFCAALGIVYALYYTVVRLFHLYPTLQRARLTLSPSQTSGSNTLMKAWSSICVMVYLAHVSYLSLLPRFDYTYNMAFNVFLGLVHNILWLAYSLPASLSVVRRFPYRPKSYRPDFVGKAAVFVASMTLAMSLELFDFPPYGRILDAHALWHLSTAPIAVQWYKFIIEDALDDGWREHKA